jgi:beta-lactamase regulating signal transducer with metallopeptidase domain
MTTLIELMRHPSIAALAWALIHFVWQGALLGAVAFVVLRIGRPARASTRYAIGVATLAAMMLAFATTLFVLAQQRPMTSPDLGPPTASTAIMDAVRLRQGFGETGSMPLQTLPGLSRRSLGEAGRIDPIGPRAQSIIVVVWALGALAMMLRLFGGWVLTRRLATRATSAVSPAVDAAARAIAARLHVRRAVAILESNAVAVPTLIGWITPVVLLPAAALAGLTPDQLRAILAHELAHVRRHDYLVNLLQSVVETLLFYHPATWWVSARVRAEREHCCDDLALEVCGDRLVYASALAELTALGGSRGLALAATDGPLLHRVRRILGGPRSVREPAPAWPLLALVIVIAGTGSFTAGTQQPAMTLAATSTAQLFAASPAAVVPAWVRPPSPPPAASADRTVPESDQAAAEPQRKAEPAWRLATADEIRAVLEKLRQGQWQLGPWKWNPRIGHVEPPAPLPAPLPANAEWVRQSQLQLAASIAASLPAPPPQDVGSRGSGNFSWSNDNEKFSVRWTGGFRLSDDEKDIEWIEDGATLTITDGVVLTSRLELRGRGAGIERQYWHNGQRRDYDPEGRAFLGAALDKMIRRSGAFAKQRVARFLKRGGPDAVLAEIDRLDNSSYVRRVYYGELLTQAPPSDALLDRVLRRVPLELKSDHDKATLLTQAAQSPGMNDSHRVAIARAAQTISSDYEQRRTLTAILNTQPLAPAVAAAVLDASDSIGSSHDRSVLLLAVVEHGGLTPATTPAFMAQLQGMSSYDQRRVLVAVSANAAVPGAVVVEAVRAAGAIPSSHDQSTALIGLIDRGGVTDASADAFFEAAGRITSAHDLSRVLLRLLERRDGGARVIEGALRTAPKISNGYNRAQVLIAVAGRGPLTGEARKLYIAASRNLSGHDENRVLAALVRAEAQ